MKKRQDVIGVLALYTKNASQMNAIHLSNIYGVLARGVRRADDVARLQHDPNFSKVSEASDELNQNQTN